MKYIPKLRLGDGIVQQSDNTRVALKKTFTFPKLNTEQAFNYSAFGTLNSPNNSYNFIQGYKKTPQQQSLSNIELNRVEKLENIQKQKVQEAKNLRHAAEVAPYIIPGLGQAMWLGKGVDLATNRVSRGKYKSWGDMINKNTGSGEFVGEFTNPGYYAGVFPKLIGKGLQSAGKYTLQKAEPYLMGDKRIPMMSYKPKSNFTRSYRDFKDLKYSKDLEITAKDALEDIYYRLDIPKERQFYGNINDDNEVKNYISRQIRKTFTTARGFSGPSNEIKNFPINNLGGRSSNNDDLFNAYYTTNSLKEAAGYGEVFLVHPKINKNSFRDILNSIPKKIDGNFSHAEPTYNIKDNIDYIKNINYKIEDNFNNGVDHLF